jgi:muramoyltetrapeptide carboxypeptidase
MRRNFIKLSTIGLGSIFLNKNIYSLNNEKFTDKGATDLQSFQKLENIYPKTLKKGSKIAITAPSSPVNIWEITNTIKFFKSLGLEVIIGDTISKQTNKFRYLSAPDNQRANELMNFIKNTDIEAIIFGRGGYGSGRILRLLDFNLIRENPKIYMGFSDITMILLAINKLTGIITFHGPVATQKLNNFTLNNFKNIFFKNKDDKLTFSLINSSIMNEGVTEGEITGGNLSMICSLMGTPYEIDTENKILFIEDVSEHAYQVDRMLTHLLNANKLQSANAIVFNGFKNLNVRKPFYPNRGYTIKEVIEQLVKPLNKPLVYNFEFGHEENMHIIPIGVKAKLDTTKKYIEIQENPLVYY